LNKKRVILITGPTASGKTSLAIQVALHFNTEIISADSRQCFRELNIGVAKPSAEQLAAVRHHFINSHSIHDEVNAAVFAAYANDVLAEIFTKHDVAVMAGGTGLYIRAFEKGLDDIPDIPAGIRNDILENYRQHGIGWLQNQLQLDDPVYFEHGEILNPQRMMRALEVKLATGRSIKEFQLKTARGNDENVARDFDFPKFAVDLPRERLYAQINQRVDDMITQGLEAEARSLLPFRHLNALQTVGYSEMFDYFDGKRSREEAIAKIKQNTRNYAKRQMTWFRRDAEICWIRTPDEIQEKVRRQNDNEI